MNATEFRATIRQLGMTTRSTSRFFKRNVTTAQRWAQVGPTEDVALLLDFMLAVQMYMCIDDVPKWIYKMAGRELEKSRKPKKISP